MRQIIKINLFDGNRVGTRIRCFVLNWPLLIHTARKMYVMQISDGEK